MDARLPAQAAAALPAAEGLPFWLLWVLLCVILLLVAFIFLRDKDLRRRLSAFLSGARRHMTRLRIQAKLRKQRDRKAALWRELGRVAWTEDVRDACIEEHCGRLASLDGEIVRHQKTWHDVFSRIEALGREHDAALRRYRALVAEQEEARRPHQEEMVLLAGKKKEVLDALEAALRGPGGRRPAPEGDKAALLQDERYRLDRRLEEAEARVRVFNEAIRRIEEEYRERLRAHEREIREWQKAKERVQDKIVDTKRLMEPIFESAGRVLDGVRLDHKDLDVVYFEIDAVDRTVAELEARLERLK